MTPQIDIKDIKPELFLDTAKSWARELQPKDKNKDKNKTSQMRKFYNEVCSLEERLAACQDKQEKEQLFSKLQPGLCMLVPKAEYAKTRKHVDENFVKMIRTCITQVDGPDTLAHFRMFFEAVIGYSKEN
ncbi:type III-A CRISPR-associated protein Csm2 [Luteithermobacter gelatinilyticus]|uniref:type III-A CRISPR-associated protein Csm2 n=1 Tax=Luteithermobacter gelatinilyticus TaxID=2582913 RepID=UPI001106CDD9|nr:type III-A CRISPR-associated protein Csm2 [Luteithermobacter gelatinilyticus]